MQPPGAVQTPILPVHPQNPVAQPRERAVAPVTTPYVGSGPQRPTWQSPFGAPPTVGNAAIGAVSGGMLGAGNPAAYGAPRGGGGGSSDPEFDNWYRAFMDEHNGQTPEDFYGGGDDPARRKEALAKAWFDKQWGDKNWYEDRPMTNYDWINTYGKRLNAYYGDSSGGGGYGGGGYSSGGGSGATPPGYTAGFTSTLGDPATYYTPERGGMAQMTTDYNNMKYLWENTTGKPFQNTDWAAMWKNVAANKAANGNLTITTFGDVYDYVYRTYLQGAQKTAQIAPLQTGNMT
jgi:hypothetical protein